MASDRKPSIATGRDPAAPVATERRLIFALDVASAAEALTWVRRLKGVVHHYKIGLELFLAGGWDVVRAVAEESGPVFLDVKLLDIPATTARALRVIASHAPHVWLANVHLFNGLALSPDLRRELGSLRIITVPVLTSMSAADLRAAGVQQSPSEYVLAEAKRARHLLYDGVVASGWEAEAIRRELGPGFCIVCPGIRPAGASLDDQSRVMTPSQAIRAGADYLVVGRPIREHADPVAAARRVQEEIAAAAGS